MENEQQKPELSAKNEEAAVVEQRFMEWERLGKFFTKLFGELLHIEADCVEFIKEGDSLLGSIKRGDQVIKNLSVKAVWLDPMSRWLADRYAVFLGQNEPSAGAVGDKIPGSFQTAVRIDSHIVLASIDRVFPLSGKDTLKIHSMSVSSVAKATERLGVMPYIRNSVEDILAVKNGIILIAAPELSHLKWCVAGMFALTGWGYVGEFANPGVRGCLLELASKNPIMVSVRGHDAIDALLRVRQFGLDPGAIPIVGVICQGFVRRVCDGCGRKAQVDPNLLKALPEFMQRMTLENYAVGRGCDQCGQNGYSGQIGVQSVIRMTDEVRSLLGAGADEMKLVNALYAKGTKPLLEDGIRKALQGQTTIESVFELTRSVPDAYVAYWKGNVASASSSSTSASSSGAAPLFANEYKKQKRAKPLILIVEDDADQRSILELVLRGANYDVSIASQGAEGLEVVAKEKPDLIISDLMMPVMDGSEFVMKLRADPKSHKIPVLMLTVVDDEDREYALLDLGADDYCDKTIQRKLLLKRIERLLARAN